MTFSKRTKTNKANAVTVYTRVNEHPDVFCVESGLLFCNYCDLTVEWRHRSTVDSHCLGKKHLAQKKIYEDNQSKKNQKTLKTTLLAADSKREVIEELIKAFASANIPIEKINHLLLFFKKYLKEGGAIPQAPTLRQLYLPSVFKNHAEILLSIFNSKPVCIIMDELSDDCAHSVVNTFFTYH
ncbi:CGG triplet repeat-binding protein 1 [Rhizophagus clarus]|uniref:CGG triplet repeat-binding protein 1 n=1 Tax=Rhizophagus clarus TaxID=94130 RepID=A0A8H3M9L1_9GLOM|nr:CGG triplet repeat-binding protein 1 [Rhizophagus clarus]